ncbi:MAG: polymer-forming cytoskeletal protein [Anaerolineaceae bacterium]
MASIPFNWKRLLIAFPLVFALLTTSTYSVSAKKLYYGNSVPSGTVIQADVVLTGNNIVIDGTVVGDVLAIGNHVKVNGIIEGSLVSAAQTIRITGKVKGTTYTAAIAFDLGAGAALSRNLYFGGLSFATRKGAMVNRDLFAFSLGGTMLGQINGNVKAVIGPYEILKLIFDALKVNVQLPGMIYDEPAIPEATQPALPSLQITPSPGGTSMESTGSLLVALPVTQITSAPTTTATTGQTKNVLDWQLVGAWFLGRLRSLVALLVFSLIALWGMPSIITQASVKLREKVLTSLGSGIVGTFISFNFILAAILIAAIITAIGFWLFFATIWEIGVFIWSAGLVLVILFITLVCFFVFYVTKAIAAYTLGYVILKPIFPKAARYNIFPLLLGLILYVLLAGLPYAGWVIGILATAFGLGAAWLVYRQKREQEKKQKLPQTSETKKSPAIKPGRKVAYKPHPTRKIA